MSEAAHVDAAALEGDDRAIIPGRPPIPGYDLPPDLPLDDLKAPQRRRQLLRVLEAAAMGRRVPVWQQGAAKALLDRDEELLELRKRVKELEAQVAAGRSGVQVVFMGSFPGRPTAGTDGEMVALPVGVQALPAQRDTGSSGSG